MHYHAEVWIPTNRLVHAQVAAAMAPYYENDESNTVKLWDWWTIGARWSGVHDQHDPSKDSRNYEPCRLCNGSGLRNDMVGQGARIKDVSYTCNGCGTWTKETGWSAGPFPGRALKFAPDFVPHYGDVCHVSDIRADLTAATLILPRNELLVTEIWDGKAFIKTEFSGLVAEALKQRGIISGYLVTVDYHS